MKIYLEKEECEGVFYDALCNGLSYIAGYGLKLLFNDEQYDKAKQTLKTVTPAEGIVCYEDVLMEVLRQGGSLTLRDLEEAEPDVAITLDEVHNRMSLVPAKNLLAVLQETGDACDADVVLQTIFLEEVIYG
jgi:hypothetical protein